MNEDIYMIVSVINKFDVAYYVQMLMVMVLRQQRQSDLYKIHCGKRNIQVFIGNDIYVLCFRLLIGTSEIHVHSRLIITLEINEISYWKFEE